MPLQHPNDKRKDEEARAARDRLRRNRHNPSSRFLGDDDDNEAKELAGVEGEKAVAHFLCLDPTPITSKKKMKGYNLVGPNGETINAITARKKPMWLPVEVGHTQADIYVQCHYEAKKDKTHLIGWATRADVLATTPRKMVSNGPDNYAVYYTALRPMDELRRLVVPHTKSMFDEPEAQTTDGG